MKTNYSQAMKQQADKLIEEGMAIMRSGEFKTAIEKFSEGIVLFPEYGLLFAYRGMAYAAAAHEADSQEYYVLCNHDFEKAIKLNPDSIEVRGFCGDEYLNLGMFDQAIDEFNAVERLDPNNRDVYLLRYICLYYRGQLDEAIQDIDKAITLDPNDPTAYSIRGMLHQFKCDSAESDFKKSFAEKSISDYTRSIELGSEHPFDYLGIGNALGCLDKHKEAIEYFNVAIEKDPTDSMAYFGRAEAYAGLNEVQKAIEDFEKCIELDPQKTSAVLDRVQEYQRS